MPDTFCCQSEFIDPTASKSLKMQVGKKVYTMKISARAASLDNLELKNYAKADMNASKIYAWVPRSEVVYLQAIFDAHEGLGRIRTEKHADDRSMILVMTTPDQEAAARDFLRQIQPEISGQIDFV